MKRHAFAWSLPALVIVGLATYWWTGGYNVAADDAHTALVSSAMTSIRERSVATRARNLKVPELESPQMISLGAKQYREMCVSCHLAPGIENTELRQGLNPRPPDLTRHGVHDPAEAFWIIKHGIKMSGMPAWGHTHDDQTLWSIVAFMQRLPKLSAKQFDELSAHGASVHKME